VQINWARPNNRGSAITGYIIKIRHSDELTFTEDTVNCDGSNSANKDATSCAIPFATLRTTPYSLPWGSSVFAKVTAINTFGQSAESASGNNAVILRVPDVPIMFQNVPAVTNRAQIGLMWTEGAQNGGTPVLDYTLQYDQGTSTWITFQSGITDTQITVIGLTQGVTYKFKILARNEYGSSAYSSYLAILAAQ
jgi:hypothetical protein